MKKNIELPRGHDSWIYLARICNSLIKSHPEAESIKIGGNHYDVVEYNINDIKAMAFDEVLECQKLSDEALHRAREIILQNVSLGDDRFDEVGTLIDMLLKLK